MQNSCDSAEEIILEVLAVTSAMLRKWEEPTRFDMNNELADTYMKKFLSRTTEKTQKLIVSYTKFFFESETKYLKEVLKRYISLTA